MKRALPSQHENSHPDPTITTVRAFTFCVFLLALALLVILPGQDELSLASASGTKGSEETATRGRGFNEDYTTYQEMISYLQDLETQYPDIVEVSVLGTSWEGRSIYAVKLSDRNNITYHGAKEPELLFIGGHHANELISVEMTLLLIGHLTTNYEEDYDVCTMVDNTEVWVVPMLNPDGHVYVEAVDSNWRKNRRDNGDGSFGVDLNRNYEYMWGVDAHTSDDPEDDNYHGPDPFSEPESRAIRNLSQEQNFSFSLSFHSHGEEILYPWGYEHDAYTEDHELLTEMARKMSEFNGYEYKKASELYPAKGDSEDYLYSEGVLPFTIELARRYAPDDFLPEVEKNLPMCLYLIHSAYKISRLQAEYSSDGRVLATRTPGNSSHILSKESIRDYFNASHQWNWLIYMSGDSSLSSQVDDDLSLIESSQLPYYLNIIVLADKNGDADTRAYIIDSSGKEEISLGTINSTWGNELRLDEVDVLADFLNWSHHAYPSENTFLEIWGHGKAWIYAVYEGSESRSMNAVELGTALQKGLALHWNAEKTQNRTLPLDILGFDECAMANIETIMESPYLTDYYIGSEKDEPFDGWPYDEIIKELGTHPFLLPWNFSSTISHTIIDFYNAHPNEAGNIPVLFSVTRTHLAPEFLDAADSLFQKLGNRVSNESFLAMLKDQRDETEEYERDYFVDFYDFLTKVNAGTDDFEINYYIEELLALQDELIVLNLKTSDEVGTDPSTENAQGLTIFFPESENHLKAPYPSLNFNRKTGWHLFLHEYINGQELECYLENTRFSFEDVEKEDDVATKIHVNFTLHSEIERDDLTLLVNGTSKHYENDGEGGTWDRELTEIIYIHNLSADAGAQDFSLSFYENFSGTLKLELIVYSSLFKQSEFNWDEAEEVSSAMTIFSRQADLYFQELSLAELGDDASAPCELYLNAVYSPGSDGNDSSILYVPSVDVKKQIPYNFQLSLSSVYFSSYCLLTVEMDDVVVYQDSYFLRENSSKFFELTLPFLNDSHSLSFILDRYDKVNETNETNNVLSFELSAYGFVESVSVSNAEHEFLLNDFTTDNATTNTSSEPFPMATALFKNTSPLNWSLSYFYAVKLLSAGTGEAYEASISSDIFDAMIESFQENEGLEAGELTLPALSEVNFTLEFPNFQTIVDFSEDHDDDVVVVLELVFYYPKNQTEFIAEKYEDGEIAELLLPVVSVRFLYTRENEENPGTNDEPADEKSGLGVMEYGIISVLGVLAFLLLLVLLRKLHKSEKKDPGPTPQVRSPGSHEEPTPHITPTPQLTLETSMTREDDDVIEIED